MSSKPPSAATSLNSRFAIYPVNGAPFSSAALFSGVLFIHLKMINFTPHVHMRTAVLKLLLQASALGDRLSHLAYETLLAYDNITLLIMRLIFNEICYFYLLTHLTYTHLCSPGLPCYNLHVLLSTYL